MQRQLLVLPVEIRNRVRIARRFSADQNHDVIDSAPHKLAVRLFRRSRNPA